MSPIYRKVVIKVSPNLVMCLNVENGISSIHSLKKKSFESRDIEEINLKLKKKTKLKKKVEQNFDPCTKNVELIYEKL